MGLRENQRPICFILSQSNGTLSTRKGTVLFVPTNEGNKGILEKMLQM